MTTAYIHTIDSQPAFFDGDQIVFAANSKEGRYKARPVCYSLDQIHTEQKLSQAYRDKKKYDIVFVCGWCKYEINTGPAK